MNNQSQYLYRLHPVRLGMLTQGPTEDEGALVTAHVAYLQAGARKGQVLMAGRTQTADEGTFGLVVLSAASFAEAENLMREDPAVQGGVMTAELFPFQIAVLSDHITPP